MQLLLNLTGAKMKQTLQIATLAISLFVGFGSTALANGTEVPKAEEPAMMQEATPPPAPMMPATSSQPSASGPYISGSIGAGIPGNNDVKTGLVLNGAVGYNFDPARIEAAMGYQRHDVKSVDGHVTYLSFMANGFYDIDAGSGLKPYVMAGMGVARADQSWRNDNTNFAWQVGTGLGVKIDDQTMFDLGYRYFRPDNGGLSLKAHNIMAGIRYQF